MTTSPISLIRGTVRRMLRGIPEPLLAQLRGSVGGDLVPAPPAPSDPFAKACEHIRDAHNQLLKLPDRVIEPEAHNDCVRDMRAHCMAAADYLHFCETGGVDGGLGLDVPDNPEAEKARSQARASAAVILAGFGRAPQRRRRGQ